MTQAARGAGAAHDASVSTEVQPLIRLSLVEEAEDAVKRAKLKVKKAEAGVAAAEKALKEAEKDLAARQKESS